MAGGTRPPTPSRYIRRGAGVLLLASCAASRTVRVEILPTAPGLQSDENVGEDYWGNYRDHNCEEKCLCQKK